MGKRINPNNLRFQAFPQWGSYCSSVTYTELFLINLYCQKWCKALFRCFFDINFFIFANKVFLTIYFYLPLKKTKKFLQKRYKYYYLQLLYKKNKLLKKKYKKRRRKIKNRKYYKFRTKKLNFKEKKLAFFRFKNEKVLYYIYQRFYYKRLLNQYRLYLENVFFKVFKKRFNIRLINYNDLFYSVKKNKTLKVIHFVLRVKLGSFYRRFNKNYKHIIKLLALGCYLKDPKFLTLVIKKLFRNPKRNFLVLRLVKSYIDIIYLIHSDLIGIKIQIKGKFNGQLRTQKMDYQQGRIPVQTINANIKYSYVTISNKVGIFGIKAWFYIGSYRPVSTKGYVISQNSIFDKEEISDMVIKNFFKTWLDEKTRKKRREQNKIKIKKKTDYDFIRKPKNTKKKIKKQLR